MVLFFEGPLFRSSLTLYLDSCLRRFVLLETRFEHPLEDGRLWSQQHPVAWNLLTLAHEFPIRESWFQQLLGQGLANWSSSIQDRLNRLIHLGLVEVKHHVAGDDQHGWINNNTLSVRALLQFLRSVLNLQSRDWNIQGVCLVLTVN